MSGFSRWEGKVAIVTGASAGIGADVAKQLVEKGLKVVGLARRQENIEQLANTLTAAPGKLYAKQCDLANEQEILEAFKWTTANVGPVSILVNNAGVTRETTLIDGETEKWKIIFDVNVIGVLIATREAVRIMRANNIDGHIINVNSMAGHIDLYFPGTNVYPASKHALTNITETLRREFNEYKLKIKVTSVSPGVVRTDFVKASGRQQNLDVFSNTRVAVFPEDVTEAILYALSTKPHVQIHEIMVRPIGEPF